jgi:hypothetical protein
MDTFLDPQSDIVIEQLAFVAAAGAAARYDEAIKGLAAADIVYHPSAFRREALAIATLEGMNPRKENLARLIGNRELTSLERDTKSAADFFDALTSAGRVFEAEVSSAGINQLFLLSDTSNGRVMRADVVWSVEDDSLWLAAQLSQLAEECNPWTAAECIREIWTSGRFLGKSRRMAMIVAPWVLQRGFGCSAPLLGLSNEIRNRIDIFREAAQSKEEWAGQLAVALHEGLRSELTIIRNVPALKLTLSALCPAKRKSSSIGKAIDFIIGNAAFSGKAFASAVDVSLKGGQDILDQLVDADVLEIEGGARNRLYICRRTI